MHALITCGERAEEGEEGDETRDLAELRGARLIKGDGGRWREVAGGGGRSWEMAVTKLEDWPSGAHPALELSS